MSIEEKEYTRVTFVHGHNKPLITLTMILLHYSGLVDQRMDMLSKRELDIQYWSSSWRCIRKRIWGSIVNELSNTL